jgi:hypothetical protein
MLDFRLYPLSSVLEVANALKALFYGRFSHSFFPSFIKQGHSLSTQKIPVRQQGSRRE